MKITHKFKSLKADSTDASLVNPTNWNEEHVVILPPGALIGRTGATEGEASSILLGPGLVIVDGVLLASKPGRVSYTVGNKALPGTLKANGAAVSRTVYNRLFDEVGTTFGPGDGVNTFNLPDLRGYFLRPWDDGRGVDAGRELFSIQNSQNVSHTHTAWTAEAGWHSHGAGSHWAGDHSHYNTGPATVSSNGGQRPSGRGGEDISWTSTGGGHTHVVEVHANGTHTHAVGVAQDGGNEARPANIALIACIEY